MHEWLNVYNPSLGHGISWTVSDMQNISAALVQIVVGLELVHIWSVEITTGTMIRSLADLMLCYVASIFERPNRNVAMRSTHSETFSSESDLISGSLRRTSLLPLITARF